MYRPSVTIEAAIERDASCPVGSLDYGLLGTDAATRDVVKNHDFVPNPSRKTYMGGNICEILAMLNMKYWNMAVIFIVNMVLEHTAIGNPSVRSLPLNNSCFDNDRDLKKELARLKKESKGAKKSAPNQLPRPAGGRRK